MTVPGGLRPTLVKRVEPTEILSLDAIKGWPTLTRFNAGDAFSRQKREILAITLPDALRALDKETLGSIGLYAPNIYLYGQNPAIHPETITPSLLKLEADHFYIKAILPISSKQAFSIWIRISPFIGFKILQQSDFPFKTWGLVANLFLEGDTAIGLHSLVELELSNPESLPLITKIDDSLSPFPGFAAFSDSSTIEFNQIERIYPHLSSSDYDAKNVFKNACKLQQNSELFDAKTAFIRSSLLTHPFGYAKALECQSTLGKPFRDKHPLTFQQIERGDRLQALTTLRAVARDYPPHSQAVLSYCLRGINEPAEGLDAAQAALTVDPLQPDVLGHKWIFLTELERDHEALETAAQHLLNFPLDPNANTNLIDSLLLCGQTEKAIIASHRYAVISPNFERALEYYFRSFEQANQWAELEKIFRFALRDISGPIPKTLSNYGETLVELGQFREAIMIFNRALKIDSADGSIILGYARALARSDQEAEAESFLRSVLNDNYHIDTDTNRALIITFLAEILRRTGRPQDALDIFTSNINEDLIALSSRMGVFPALEYAESLYELKRIDEVRNFLTRLKKLWPEDPYVCELYDIVWQ